MIVKLCPMCDSELKGSTHYCKVCHSIVWKPNVLDVHYDVESRGMYETDCAYGEVHEEIHHKRKSLQTKKKHLSDARKKVDKEMTSNNKNGLIGILAKIIGFLIFINVIGSLISSVMAFFLYGI